MSDLASLRREYEQSVLESVRAAWDYEDTLVSRDPTGRELASARLAAAHRRESLALAALVQARRAPITPPRHVTFMTLLNDPTQQLDPDGEVMRSIIAYQNATSNTPSADEADR